MRDKIEEQKQKRYDKYFMDVAKLTAHLSRAKRKKVGAILVKDKRICSMGFNGTPHGFDNCCEDEHTDGSLVTKTTVVHAESNAIFWCAKSQIPTDGATLYLTLSPCETCALAIIQSGIQRVVYLEQYRKDDGIKVLRRAGVKVEKYKECNIELA